ncbi:hypothetical protein [Rhodococcus sp. H29-C3]|uniref:hypothetical protein n=1 Tax=Rhodococcus sp. H29-C3 TaxID=3046307 RepID=UPI0024B91E74|nr:hypothetical protein [Rhodococcus sp. H29-C3]MDJ0363014.1 hypothetical protein [Rhodococcus sp. H29-C3]
MTSRAASTMLGVRGDLHGDARIVAREVESTRSGLHGRERPVADHSVAAFTGARAARHQNVCPGCYLGDSGDSPVACVRGLCELLAVGVERHHAGVLRAYQAGRDLQSHPPGTHNSYYFCLIDPLYSSPATADRLHTTVSSHPPKVTDSWRRSAY